MLVYWSLFFVIILIQFVPLSSNVGYKLKLIIPFLLMVFYASIRDDYGLDFPAYKHIFDKIHKYDALSGNSRIELGYVLLNMIMPSYRALLILLSVFTCLTYYFLFRWYIPPKYYWLGFILMAISGDKMLFFQLSGLRNAIAINIMVLSLPLIIKRSIIPYIGLTILAFFFHNSVLFFMPLAYFIATPNSFQKRDVIIWSLVVIILLTISTTSLIENISPIINNYFEKYSSYLKEASDNEYERSILMYGFVLMMFTMSFIILLREKLSKNDRIVIKLSFLFLISLVLGTMSFRMGQYFIPYLVAGSTVVMYQVKNTILKYAYLSTVILFLWYSFFIVFMGMSKFPYAEYHTIFD